MAHRLEVSVTPGQTVEAAFARILGANLALIRGWEPVALAGNDIEGVHQMRVGLRRMRSAMTVFRAAIPRNLTKPLAREMSWAAGALDRARDLDVYLAENYPGKGGKHQRKMERIARKHREQAYKRLRGVIQSKRYLSFKRELDRWIDAKAWREQLPEEGRKCLRCRITPFTCRVLEQLEGCVLEAGKNIEELDGEALHRLRIECKKLRYATEFFAPLYGERMQDFTRHLKALQDLLGTLHDTAVLPGLQKDILKDNHSTKLRCIAGKLEDKRERECKEIRKHLMQRWQMFSGAEHPWLKARVRKAAA